MEPLLTTGEVAALLRFHPKHVYRLLRQGLPAQRVGGEWRFLRSAVLEWADSRVEAHEAAPVGAMPAAMLAANGDVVIDILLQTANTNGPLLLGFVRADRELGLKLLRARSVLAAGCHGAIPPARLGGERLARIHLVEREVGLVARGDVPALDALSALRFASRPASAGIVTSLKSAARRAGLDPDTLLGKVSRWESHAEVCCAVLRGDADVGLATRAWAHRAGLGFRTLGVESYGLLVEAADLGDPRVVRICEIAQSDAFGRALATIPGYDPVGAGDIRYDSEGPVTSAPKEPVATSTSIAVPTATSPAARTTARSGKRRTIA